MKRKLIKRQLKYFLILPFFLFIFFFVMFFRLKSNSDISNVINLGEVTRSVFYCPQYVALELGFFKEEGLDINLNVMNGSDKAMTALITNKIDVVLAGSACGVYVRNQGHKSLPIAFCQLTKRDGNFIIGKDKNFLLENLNNKKIICGRKGGMPHIVFLYIVNKNKINAELLTNISIDSMASSYKANTGDYVNLLEPSASNLLSVSDESKILASVSDFIEKEIPYTVYWCLKKFSNENSQKLKKFTNAIKKAQTWVSKNDPKKIAHIIKPYFIDDDIECLTSCIEKYKKIDVWCQIPRFNENSIDFLFDVLLNSKEINENSVNNFDEIFTNDFIE